MYDLKKILTLKDVRNGFKKLKKKNKYKHPQNYSGVFLRFESNKTSDNYNALGKFVDKIKKKV